MPKPLAGIRVIELANFIAGPLCGTLLADMGADVVKVEPPQGDMARATPPLRNGERELRRAQPQQAKPGARSQAAGGLRNPEQARGAIGRAGGGLPAGRARQARPRPGRPQSGQPADRLHLGVGLRPDRTGAAARRRQSHHRGILRRAVGDWGARQDADAAGVQTADVFGAVCHLRHARSLVGAARNGEGRIADVSLVEASIAAAAWEAAEYLETGEVPQPLGHKHRLSAPYQLFETSDGRYLAIGAPNDGLFGKFMEALGLEAHCADPRFASYSKRKANEEAIVAIVEPAIRKWRSDDLEQALIAAGVPCARVNNYKEVFEHPQIVARGMMKTVEHPRLGAMKVARNPVLLDHDGPDLARPSPLLGEHSEEILRELGYAPSTIQEPQPRA
jgi:crotonobetainyl-CoA:carnitine CoA-transferase CaiB-like acyl-CoA transferase